MDFQESLEENINLKKKFINNIIFGQKLINSLSLDKKKDVNIDYFLNHIKNFNEKLTEINSKNINYQKYDDLQTGIKEKLEEKNIFSYKNKSFCIEPYCLKPIKFYSSNFLFKKFGFHHQLIKLESKFYDLFGIIYHENQINGYIVLGKRLNGEYKNLYVIISEKYPEDFFLRKDKKITTIHEINDNISFYESETYQNYLKNYRNSLFSIINDILKTNETVKNIIFIGEERGGNLLELFAMDFLNNKNNIENFKYNIKSLYLFHYNSAMLSNQSFYKELIKQIGNKSFINCFKEENDAFLTWEKSSEELITIIKN